MKRIQISTDDRALAIVAKFVAVALVVMHIIWMFYKFLPISMWIDYHSVIPAKESFMIDKKLRFIAHTDLNRPVLVTFLDTLYCRGEDGGDFERYAMQPNHRFHDELGKNRYTTFIFSPGVPYETECYLDTRITLHLPLHVERYAHYNGLEHNHIFKIVKDQKEFTEQCIEELFGAETSAGAN